MNKYQFARELIDLYEKHGIEIEEIDIITAEGITTLSDKIIDEDKTGMSE